MPSFECEGILCNGAMDKSAAIIDQDIYIYGNASSLHACHIFIQL